MNVFNILMLNILIIYINYYIISYIARAKATWKINLYRTCSIFYLSQKCEIFNQFKIVLLNMCAPLS